MNPNSRPNILILMTDQQRFDALGCAGTPLIRTPNLDALAASGVQFANACTSTPVCVAARMSFITGHRAARTHWVDNSALPGGLPELPTIMTLLQREGYWTQGIGKMHFRGRHYGFRKLLTMEEGVTNWVDDDYMIYLRTHGVRARFPKGIRDLLYFQPQTSGVPLEHSHINWVSDRSIEFLKQHTRYRREQPFFLWSSWIAPHPPFAPVEPYDEMYDPDQMQLPVYADRPLSNISSCFWSQRRRLDGAHRDPDRMRRIRALYYGLVTHVDDAIGRILNQLDQLGLTEDTVVLFTSDHGEMLGDHGLSQKNCPYEASVRIPMILRWPGMTQSGRVCDDLVGLTDVLPTFDKELNLAYTDVYGPLTGDSLLGRVGGGLATSRHEFVIDHGVGPKRWLAIRTHTHKYALFAADGVEELYDLKADPWETRNLASDLPDLAARFRQRVMVWEREHGLATSFENGGAFRTYPRPGAIPTEAECCGVVVNEGPWAKRLPDDEKHTVETYAEAFTRAIRKETTLTPDKLSLKAYKQHVLQLGPEDPGGEPLVRTPWEDAWHKACRGSSDM